MTRGKTLGRRAYRLLLRAYPSAYRIRFGPEMEDTFVALLGVAGERFGGLGVLLCWGRATVDVAWHGLATRWRTTMGGATAPATHPTNEGKGGDMLGTFGSDVRYALRSLSRRPVFASTAILTIAIGIGANAAVFTIVNGFLFTPLPYEEPDELVAVWAAQPSLGWSGTDVNYADAWDWRARATSLEDLTVFNDDGFNLTGGDKPELVAGLRVTPNFLSVLGRPPVLGRDFESDEMGEGLDRVVILSDGFWERRFARDPDVLGATLTLDGVPVAVVGILPPDFRFHDDPFDLLRPWHFDFGTAPRDSHSANAVARLADGVTIDMARDELVAVAEELAAEHPENEGWTVEVRPLHEDAVGEVASQASVVLMTAVGFILLMACVNVANLLLARAGGREREMAVRVALGAGRARVVRQLLTESLVLATVGGLLGLLGGVYGYRAIVAALPSTIPPVFQFEMDANVLGFTALITIGAALLFGVLPALRATEARSDVLRDGGRSGGSRRSSRVGGALVVLQTAMAVILLVGGGLLMKSVAGMRSQDFGFDPENVLTARIALPSSQYATREASEAYWREVTDRVRDVPGVIDVGTTQSHPLMGSNWGRTVRIAAQDLAEDRERTVRLTLASPGLFEALRYGMLRGRVFRDADGPDAPNVAIVNEAFVQRYLGPDDDPLAQTILSGDDWSAAIVGVVHDVIERSIERPPEPSLYLPIAQSDIRTRSLVMRTVGAPADLVSGIQDAVWTLDADIPVYAVQTMDSLLEDRVGGFAVIGYLMGVFAILSLILGAVGIYGVTAYAAGRRIPEIGLRLAMGAESKDVVGLVVRQGARRAVIGLVIGLAVAAMMGGAMSSILIGVSPRDPVTFGTVLTMLGIVSFLGLYIPARRASQVDPVKALTSE